MSFSFLLLPFLLSLYVFFFFFFFFFLKKKNSFFRIYSSSYFSSFYPLLLFPAFFFLRLIFRVQERFRICLAAMRNPSKEASCARPWVGPRYGGDARLPRRNMGEKAEETAGHSFVVAFFSFLRPSRNTWQAS